MVLEIVYSVKQYFIGVPMSSTARIVLLVIGLLALFTCGYQACSDHSEPVETEVVEPVEVEVTEPAEAEAVEFEPVEVEPVEVLIQEPDAEDQP
jgi:hypothetical protein